MSTIATLPFVSSEGGLSRYLVEIQKFPLLTVSEEVSYARRWREHGDREAAYRLVTSHLRLAAKIAMKYRRYGLPRERALLEARMLADEPKTLDELAPVPCYSRAKPADRATCLSASEERSARARVASSSDLAALL